MSAGAAAPAQTTLTVSPGLVGWLRRHAVSLAFTSYRTGQLFLAGAHPNGTISINQQPFGRATGLCWQGGRLWVGSDRAIYRLENIVAPGALAHGAYDAMLVPRAAAFTGDVATGELAVGGDGGLVFVSARYACLAAPDERHALRIAWRPSALGEGGALTGLAIEDGAASYVTASPGTVGEGVVIDVTSGDVVVEGLALPHSPRLGGDTLFVLESGRGRILSYNRATGAGRAIGLCPGFLRGLALHAGLAIVTVSRTYDAPSLDQDLADRGVEPWCGIQIIDLASGALVEWIRFEGRIDELFDVVAMPGIVCPAAVGPATDEQLRTVSIADATA